MFSNETIEEMTLRSHPNYGGADGKLRIICFHSSSQPYPGRPGVYIETQEMWYDKPSKDGEGLMGTIKRNTQVISRAPNGMSQTNPEMALDKTDFSVSRERFETLWTALAPKLAPR